VGKTTVAYVTFVRDVACQKLLKSANVSRSYSQNNTGTVFFETQCRYDINSTLINMAAITATTVTTTTQPSIPPG